MLGRKVCNRMPSPAYSRYIEEFWQKDWEFNERQAGEESAGDGELGGEKMSVGEEIRGGKRKREVGDHRNKADEELLN